MIKKSIITLILLLIAYSIIRNYIFKDVKLSQSNWQKSQCPAQDYMYSDKDYNIILTGSSVALDMYQFLNDSLGNIILAFAGENSLSGLKVINYRGDTMHKYPKYVLIEVPTIRQLDNTISSSIMFNPIMIYPRKFFPIFRDGKQPMPWIAARLNRYLPYITPYQINLGREYLDPIVVDIKNKYYSKVSSLQKKDEPNNIFQNLDINTTNEPLLNDKEYNILEKDITTLIDPLIEHGVIPIFFYPPNKRAEHTSIFNSTKDIIDKHYPISKYPRVINCPDSAFVNSGDNIHLPDKRFENYLKSQVDSITKPIYKKN